MKRLAFLNFCLATILLIWRCKQAEPLAIAPRPIVDKPEQAALFSKWASKPQVFNLNLRADTAVTCQNGTVISVQQGAFVDQNGEVVTDNVQLRVIEALNFGDYLRNDLQTVAGGQLLQTAGMLYLDATANGQALALQEGMPLRVELPIDAPSPGYKVFNGSHDAQGNINWEETGTLDEGMIPLPLSELDLKYYTAYQFSKQYEIRRLMDSVVINDPKYEGTYIATREFEQRLTMLGADNSEWWEGYDTYLDKHQPTQSALNNRLWEEHMTKTGKTFKIHCEPIQIYLDHTDKPLWVADSLVADFLLNKAAKDSLRWSKVRTDEDDWSHYDWYYFKPFFKQIADLRLTQPKHYDPKGVDMGAPNAKELLVQKGYSPTEAFEQLQLHRTRARILEQRRAAKEKARQQQLLHAAIDKAFSASFKVEKLGWINVDRFYDDPKAKEVELFALVKVDSLPFCDMNLLLPDMGLAINGIEMEQGRFRFTEDDQLYRKLPLGEKAILIAISAKEGKPYLGMQPFTIQGKQTVEVALKETTWEELEQGFKK